MIILYIITNQKNISDIFLFFKQLKKEQKFSLNKMKNINYHFMMKTDGNTLLELLNFSLVQINIKIVVEYLKNQQFSSSRSEIKSFSILHYYLYPLHTNYNNCTPFD